MTTSELKPPCRNKPAWGRDKTNILGWISFFWTIPLMRVGKQRDLVVDDIDEISLKDSSRFLLKRFSECWKNELIRSPSNPSLWRTIFHTLGLRRWILQASTLFFYQAVQCVIITCLQRILQYIDTKNSPETATVTYHQALGYAAGMVVCATYLAFHHHTFYYEVTRNGIVVRTFLALAIFDKTLRISPNSIPSAQVMNVMSTDAQRFQEFFKMLPLGLIAPGTVVIALCYVCLFIAKTWYPFLGLLVYITLVPVQIQFAKKFGKLRDQAVQHTDARLKLINEVLTGCLAMKMYCWEKPLYDAVTKSRKLEIKYISRAAMIKAFNFSMVFCSQALIGLCVFVPFYMVHGHLDPSIVYPVLVFFGLWRHPILFHVPVCVQIRSELVVSVRRITQFLLTPEICDNMIQMTEKGTTLFDDIPTDKKSINIERVISNSTFNGETEIVSINNNTSNETKNKSHIVMNGVNFSWNSVPQVTLKRVLTSKRTDRKQTVEILNRNLSVAIPLSRKQSVRERADLQQIVLDIGLNNDDQLIAVVGRIGCGKSSLLSAIIGEMPIKDSSDKDNLSIKGTKAYTSQKAWIYSASVKENILFGQEWDEKWYEQVITSCALIPDLQLFPHGDETIIGERGINLSGGQKARVGLARSVYAKADITLLDDPLAAVDSVVAKHIFDNVLDKKTGILKGIKILVTHQTQFLSRVDKVIVMEHGQIAHYGSLTELKEKGVNIQSLIDETLKEKGENDHNLSSSSSSSLSSLSSLSSQEKQMDQMQNKNREINKKQVENKSKDKALKESIIQIEEVQTGKVNKRNYLYILPSKNEKTGVRVLQVCGLLFLMFIAQLSLTFSEYGLGYFSSLDYDEQKQKKNYVYIYCGWIACTLCLALMRAMFCFHILILGAHQLHDRMFKGVLYAPMHFFESNPIGRMLNRFSKDQWIVDEMLPFIAYDALQVTMLCSMTIFIAGFANIWVLVLVVPTIVLFIRACGMYVNSSRSLRRLDGLTRSPIFAQLSMIFSGLAIVRAFKKSELMLKNSLDLVDINTRINLMFEAISRWLGFVSDITATFLVGSTAMVCIHLDASPEAAGLVLTYMVFLSGSLQWAIRQTAEMENYMTSVERILEYKSLTPEGWVNNNGKPEPPVVKTPPSEWPETGDLTINHLHARYRDHLEDVLSDICVSFKANEKIGVVGRTGSGKSSLFLTLFRLLEPYRGHVELNKMNCNELALHDLRSKFSIIPQEPVLFTETLRYNIDPLNLHTDKEIMEVLEIVQMHEMVQNQLKEGLDTLMSEHGSNFSAGEAQLICVARALLHKSKILLVDEATSNVDPATDMLIQKVLREKFKDRTVLTIAHRLQTVLDCDRILVLDRGKVIEFDTPTNLLNKDSSTSGEGGVFRHMVQQLNAHST